MSCCERMMRQLKMRCGGQRGLWNMALLYKPQTWNYRLNYRAQPL